MTTPADETEEIVALVLKHFAAVARRRAIGRLVGVELQVTQDVGTVPIADHAKIVDDSEDHLSRVEQPRDRVIVVFVVRACAVIAQPKAIAVQCESGVATVQRRVADVDLSDRAFRVVEADLIRYFRVNDATELVSKCHADILFELNAIPEVSADLKFTGSEQIVVVMDTQAALITGVRVVDTAVVLVASQHARRVVVVQRDGI